MKYLWFVTNSCSLLYTYRLDTCLQPDDMEKYINDQLIFFKNLREDIRKRVLYRPYSRDVWGAVDTIKEQFPDMRIVPKGKNIDWMKKAHLIVIDHCQTSMIEALVMNKPTILFWDSSVTLLREEAQVYLNGLEWGEVYHKTPEAAALKVNKIWDDPVKWWKEGDTPLGTWKAGQKIKGIPEIEAQNWCGRYAKTSKDWTGEWAKEIKNIINEK